MKDFINRINKHKSLIVTILYALITFIFLTRHEMWRDEVNVWAVLQNITLSDLPKHVTLDGHPIIFFLLFYPFVKLGLSVKFLQIITWLASTVSIFLLHRFAPFSFITKLIITLSAPCMYWFAVISRSYSLLPVVLFGFAAIHKKLNNLTLKDKNYGLFIITSCLLAGFTANIHLIFDMLGGALFIVYLWEQFIEKKEFNKSNITGTIIFVLMLFPPAVQTFVASHINPTYAHGMSLYDTIFSLIRTSLDINSNLFSNINTALFNANTMDILVSFYMFAIALSLVCLFVCNKKSFFIVIANLIFHLIVYTKKYAIFFPYRVYTLQLILIAGFWLAFDNNKNLNSKQKKLSEIVLAVIMLLTVPSGVRIIGTDWDKKFSPDKEIAAFIDKNIGEGSTIYMQYPAETSLVGYHLKSKQLLISHKGEQVKYIKVYDEQIMKELPKALNEKTYLLGRRQEDKRLTKIFCAKSLIEDYCLFKIKTPPANGQKDK